MCLVLSSLCKRVRGAWQSCGGGWASVKTCMRSCTNFHARQAAAPAVGPSSIACQHQAWHARPTVAHRPPEQECGPVTFTGRAFTHKVGCSGRRRRAGSAAVPGAAQALLQFPGCRDILPSQFRHGRVSAGPASGMHQGIQGVEPGGRLYARRGSSGRRRR